MRDVTQRGDALSAQPQSSDPAVLADRKKQIDTLTADFKRLSNIVLPLAKASLLLDATTSNLAEWRGETQRAYSTQGRELLLRIGVLLLAIIVVAIAADAWRRAIFRYIAEQRRRSQFLLLRRIVVTAVIILILIFALSTEIGSLATFAGFLTAGVAIALQNVILSVAAYFLLIGRYGIRVGDRIQIGEVTGDVFNIGLVRLYLVELDVSGSEARPTDASWSSPTPWSSSRLPTFSSSFLAPTLPGGNSRSRLPPMSIMPSPNSLSRLRLPRSMTPISPNSISSTAFWKARSPFTSAVLSRKPSYGCRQTALKSSFSIQSCSPRPQRSMTA